ncbi:MULTISPECIES: AI-2E family transporter [unclassified Roseovarius]|uniref:AI-2E family transporter n=1 Tax=unclassified Roseovarius TaxID=2614913 RepID=UPI00273FA23D|nr:AI-2E family transporter [Roseovarius sp. MMSF_3350]
MDHAPSKLVRACLLILTFLAVVAAAKMAQNLLAPATLAIVLGVVLSPLAARLENMGVPRAVSAALALLTAAAMIFVLLAMLGPVLSALADQVPRIQQQFRGWLNELTYMLRSIGGISFDLERTISEGGEDAVEEAIPSVVEALWLAPNLLAQLLIFAGTLFFFLLTRDELYSAVPHFKVSLKHADQAVAYYFVTITLINFGLGVALCGLLLLIGLPNPMLWGAAAFLANFVLYLGPLAIAFSLLMAGLVTFSSAYALVPPVAFLCLNAIEAQFVTPALVGKRMSVNPLIVFLSIVFGLWLWGPLGGIVALPVVIWVYALVSAQSKRGTASEYKMEQVA